jgi:hypothetical protein
MPIPERRGHDGRRAGFGLDQNVPGDHVHPPNLLPLFNRYAHYAVINGSTDRRGPGQIPRSLNGGSRPGDRTRAADR